MFHRYVWDGYVANQGVSPYAHPIDSPALDYLDIPQRALIDHTWMASPYLPAAQALFFTVTRIFPLQPIYFQISMVIFDILTGILLVSLLRIARLPVYRVYIYLWNPLVIIEVAHGAHVDAWMIFLTMLTLWLVFSDRIPKVATWLGPVILAFAILTKALPILILAVLFWRWRWWQIILCATVLVMVIVPTGLTAGWGISGPLDGHWALWRTAYICSQVELQQRVIPLAGNWLGRLNANRGGKCVGQTHCWRHNADHYVCYLVFFPQIKLLTCNVTYNGSALHGLRFAQCYGSSLVFTDCAGFFAVSSPNNT